MMNWWVFCHCAIICAKCPNPKAEVGLKLKNVWALFLGIESWLISNLFSM